MSDTDAPIHSALDDDPAAADALDAFVVALAERVDELQDLEAQGDLRGLAGRVRELGGDAGRLGYAPLQRSADEALRAAEQGDGELAHKALVVLTDVARRVRLGHRGSI